MSNIGILTSLTGDKRLNRKLAHLAKKGQKKVARSALSKGLSVIAKGIRKEAPVGKTKAVRKAIGKRLRKNKRTGIHEAKVGVNVAKKKGKQAPHGHLVAAGTAERQHKSGKSTGSVDPNPFVERGFRATQGKAMSTIKKTMRDGIEKEARKG